METLGKTIRKARLSKGWTQDKLIEEMADGLTQGRLSLYERDKERPNSDRLQRLANILGFKLENTEVPRRSDPSNPTLREREQELQAEVLMWRERYLDKERELLKAERALWEAERRGARPPSDEEILQMFRDRRLDKVWGAGEFPKKK